LEIGGELLGGSAGLRLIVERGRVGSVLPVHLLGIQLGIARQVPSSITEQELRDLLVTFQVLGFEGDRHEGFTTSFPQWLAETTDIVAIVGWAFGGRHPPRVSNAKMMPEGPGSDRATTQAMTTEILVVLNPVAPKSRTGEVRQVLDQVVRSAGVTVQMVET